MYIVNKKQVELIDGKLFTEASTLELKPGEWPDHIAVVDDAGQGYLFQRGRIAVQPNGFEMVGYHYWARGTSVELFVAND